MILSTYKWLPSLCLFFFCFCLHTKAAVYHTEHQVIICKPDIGTSMPVHCFLDRQRPSKMWKQFSSFFFWFYHVPVIQKNNDYTNSRKTSCGFPKSSCNVNYNSRGHWHSFSVLQKRDTTHPSSFLNHHCYYHYHCFYSPLSFYVKDVTKYMTKDKITDHKLFVVSFSGHINS